MTDELKPVRCGCGGEALIQVLDYKTPNKRYYVVCNKCGTTSWLYLMISEAIEAWNRAMGNRMELQTVERTAKVETVEKPNVFKCSECGQYFHQTSWGSPVEYCSRCGTKIDWSGNE